MAKKYQYFNGIPWSTAALADFFDCKPEEVEGEIEKRARAKKTRESIPTAAQTKKSARAAMESTPSEAIEADPILKDADDTEIHVDFADGDFRDFETVNVTARVLDCKESQVIAALSRGSWKARKIASIVRRAVA